MGRQPRPHRAYRALLHLYPKSHQKDYGEQMVQTFDDLLHEDRSTQHAVAVWLRVGRELPFNIVEEHISNWEGSKMNNGKSSGRIIVAVGVVAVVVIGVMVGLLVMHRGSFSPTTLADIQGAANKPACVQPAANSQLQVSNQDTEFVGNAAASSIIDVPAGTNVDVFFKTFTASKATGSAVYSGSYGKYNFTAEHTQNDAGGYTGGWKITQFAACKS